jgi:alanyl-tRNA synthetase
MKTVNDIRNSFLDYFEQNSHEVVASSSLVPMNDPTLLFTNAGMVQFKNVFTGGETRATPRAVTSQKCVRAGGKHNDLENVGHTARHHTFFEMLGNFSFGDYFKEEAIHHAWTLITDVYGLPKDKLLVTIYHDDDEAARWWKKIAGLPEDKIIRIATSDNFWSMGDTGPCGPCSEIFYDHGEQIPGGPPGSEDEDGDRFIEIWNLVFMQYEQKADGERINLPKPSIDTGMGLERIAATLQGFNDNYATDMMRALIEASADVSSVSADGEHAISHRVIADHLRASSFLIADGVLPSNEGRGYVLRRIMRRGMRHAHQMGCIEPMMHRLVPALVQEMGSHFNELRRNENLIAETLKTEETRFKETLGRGLKILTDKIKDAPEGGTLDGDTAFKLYDTYGFPLDLTQDVMRGFKWSVDLDGFSTAMDKQKAKARKAWSGSGDSAMAPVYMTLADQLGATEFLGYELNEAEGQITALVSGEESTDHAVKGQEIAIVTNQTTFFAESGGQIGDRGVLTSPQDKAEILAEVTDTWKTPTGLFVHTATVTADRLNVGDNVMMVIDAERRDKLRSNHSATHLMHEALREVLGAHVMQKGSLVASERLRFDFNHAKQVSGEEIAEVEKVVNERIGMNTAVTTRLMTPDAAIEEGALALFGEKYGEEVRVVSMGGPTKVKGRAQWSVELCGGTHVRQTGDIGLFKVTSESAVAGGIRRIDAATNQDAMSWLDDRLNILNTVTKALKTSPEQLNKHLDALLLERRKADQAITNLRKKLAEGSSSSHGKVIDDPPYKVEAEINQDTSYEQEDFQLDQIVLQPRLYELLNILDHAAAALKTSPEQLAARLEILLDERKEADQTITELKKSLAEGVGSSTEASEINGIAFETRMLDNTPARELKSIAESILKKMGSGVTAVISRDEGKASIVVAVSKDLTKSLDAVKLVQAGSKTLGGKGGGGRPDMAQAGGPDGSKSTEALKAIADVIAG